MWSAGFGSTIMRGMTTNLSRSDKHKSSSSWSDTITTRSYTNLNNRVESASKTSGPRTCDSNCSWTHNPLFEVCHAVQKMPELLDFLYLTIKSYALARAGYVTSLNFSTSPASERTCEHVPTAHTDDVSLVMQRVGWLFRYGLSLTRIWEARIWWKLCPADLAAPGMSL